MNSKHSLALKRKELLSIFMACYTAASGSANAQAAMMPSAPDNVGASFDAAKPLKTRVPSISDRHAPVYIMQVQNSQAPAQISDRAVQQVELNKEGSAIAPINLPDSQSEPVALKRPSLRALISVQENLSPFSFDARYIESVGLEDALRAATGENLTIANSYSQVRIQKNIYLSAMSKYLPDLKGGYNLLGLNGSIPSSLLGGSSAGTSLSLPSAAQILTAGFNYNLYQGGKVWASTLEQKHRFRATRAALKGSINDVLLDTAKHYYDLILNEALLSIRTRAVEISAEQVRLNTVQERAGTATGLDVLQSQAQLASDEQSLIDQQQKRRQAAIQLSSVLNTSFAQDLVSAEESLFQHRVIPKTASIEELLKIAIDNRPELKQYEELRLASKRAITVAAATLQPKVALGGSVYGAGVKSESLNPIYVLNFSVNWNLGGLGTTDLANIQTAKWQARQSAIQAKQIFQNTFDEVRSSYDQSLAADRRISKASIQIAAAEEELRIAKKRMESGVGLNIDVLNAQRDWTQASVNKAQAIIDFNRAQAQLLRDTGLISISSLTRGASL